MKRVTLLVVTITVCLMSSVTSAFGQFGDRDSPPDDNSKGVSVGTLFHFVHGISDTEADAFDGESGGIFAKWSGFFWADFGNRLEVQTQAEISNIYKLVDKGGNDSWFNGVATQANLFPFGDSGGMVVVGYDNGGYKVGLGWKLRHKKLYASSGPNATVAYSQWHVWHRWGDGSNIGVWGRDDLGIEWIVRNRKLSRSWGIQGILSFTFVRPHPLHKRKSLEALYWEGGWGVFWGKL
jgi:hypothetical protein